MLQTSYVTYKVHISPLLVPCHPYFNISAQLNPGCLYFVLVSDTFSHLQVEFAGNDASRTVFAYETWVSVQV